jgi:ABC-type transport system involved in multi-copper enzyme maturation permease subunit
MKKHLKYIHLNFFALVKKTFFELFTLKRFLVSLLILLFLPSIFLLFPITANLGSSPISVVISLLRSSVLFPLYFWTLGVAYTTLIALNGAPLISEKVSSGAMLILVSKPIRRENIYFGKLLGLILYNILLAGISLYAITWIIVFRYTGNLAHFTFLLPFILSTFFYSLLINIIFSVFTISISSIINNSRFVLLILLTIILYTFVIFTLIQTFFTGTNIDPPIYHFDLGYHLVNIYMHSIETFEPQLNIGRWLLDFHNFTDYIGQIIHPMEFFRTNYYDPLISLLIWIILIPPPMIGGLYAFKKKEITV